ncbi:MAG TPA: phosphatidylglycerol lysyltransferase domain-containing protein [Anaerovoracaceae bacterium]|nr:phosphatidylglycerol lysyltransferase domain-containing protein [Anaerovoracaceae bacterium]
MFMLENQITIEKRPVLEEYLQSFEYGTSGMSFTSLYMWRNINNFSWQIIGDYLCVSGLSHLELEKEEPFLFPPFTKTGTYDPKSLNWTIKEAKKIFESKGYVFSIRLMPTHMIDIIEAACPGEFQFFDDRPNYDYVYRTQDLIDLKGREFHSKKNHLNYFLNHYKYEYVVLTSAMAEQAMQFIREFNERKQLPDHEMQLLKMEERAMSDVLHNLEAVGYLTAAIVIDGKIEALCIGGKINKNTIDVHVEKANIAYRGLYQLINNEFCKHVAANIEYINREEDMGIPGLRKAKLSYKPVKLVEHHIAIFKKDL